MQDHVGHLILTYLPQETVDSVQEREDTQITVTLTMMVEDFEMG